MRRQNTVIIGGLLFIFTLTVHLTPAQAGFEWKPAPTPAQTPSNLESVPVVTTKAANKPQVLKLEKIESDPKPSPTAKAVNESALIKTTNMPKAPTPKQEIKRPIKQHVKQMIINPYPAKQTQPIAQPAAPAPAVTPANNTDNEIVQGFGSDIPLAFALSQIVPAHYGYSFGIGVNPGYRVSWNGGRPWQTIVKDMVKPLDLMMRIHGKKLIIEKYDAAAMEPAPQPVQPALAKEAPTVTAQPTVIKRQNITNPGPAPKTNSTSTGQPQMLVKQTAEMEIEDYKPEDKPTAPSQQSRVWKAEQGKSLRSTLGSWSNQVNVGMVWNVSHDFPVTSNLVVNGNYSDAISMVLSHGIESNAPITHSLIMHEGSDVVKTLIVKDRS